MPFGVADQLIGNNGYTGPQLMHRADAAWEEEEVNFSCAGRSDLILPSRKSETLANNA